MVMPLVHSPVPMSYARPAMPIRTTGTKPYLAIHCVSKLPPPKPLDTKSPRLFLKANSTKSNWLWSFGHRVPEYS